VVPRVVAVAAAVILLLVAVPEMLGDKPYDPKPSAWPRSVSKFVKRAKRPVGDPLISERVSLAVARPLPVDLTAVAGRIAEGATRTQTAAETRLTVPAQSRL
jgi:hypothetical protein